MKISNENRKIYFQLVNTVFIISLMLIAFGFFISYGKLKSNLVISAVVLIALYIVHKWRGYPFFLYDSDGETLNFMNKDFHMFFGDPRVIKKAEFPKRKLLGYKVVNYVLKKKLVLIVKSKRTESEKTRQTFDVTYLRNSEIKDLKRSLDKVRSNNIKLENTDGIS